MVPEEKVETVEKFEEEGGALHITSPSGRQFFEGWRLGPVPEAWRP